MSMSDCMVCHHRDMALISKDFLGLFSTQTVQYRSHLRQRRHRVPPRSIKLPSGSQSQRFYSSMERAQQFPAPAFIGDHAHLCVADKETRQRRGWAHCMPMSGRKDSPHCSSPDRADLLAPQTRSTVCFASVLHVLLHDVYEELHAAECKPALLYGTLLGAVRNDTVIPFSEDVDIGYQLISSDSTMEVISDLLWQRGYHMFKETIWRVCVAATHPLAGNLYNLVGLLVYLTYQVPYVDLYEMQQASKNQWRIDFTDHGRLTSSDQFEPYTQVQVNGMKFDTVADLIDFLMNEFGKDYLTPRPRASFR